MMFFGLGCGPKDRFYQLMFTWIRATTIDLCFYIKYSVDPAFLNRTGGNVVLSFDALTNPSFASIDPSFANIEISMIAMAQRYVLHHMLLKLAAHHDKLPNVNSFISCKQTGDAPLQLQFGGFENWHNLSSVDQYSSDRSTCALLKQLLASFKKKSLATLVQKQK